MTRCFRTPEHPHGHDRGCNAWCMDGVHVDLAYYHRTVPVAETHRYLQAICLPWVTILAVQEAHEAPPASVAFPEECAPTQDHIYCHAYRVTYRIEEDAA